jgi:hypothetical protein
MSRWLERLYPFLVPLSLAYSFWRMKIPFPQGQDVLSASITMGAVFTGFLATLKTIVISLQSPRIELLRQTKFFSLLITYLQEAVWMSLIFCMWGLGGFFYDQTKPPTWFGAVWVFCAAATILTFLRVSSILVSLIKAS